MKYFHIYDAIKDLTVLELIKRIKKEPKLSFKDLKFVDILFNVESLVGVYVMFDDNDNVAYVGKTEGRSFLERLAAHFDLRPEGYMNHFLKSLTGKPRGKNSPISLDDLKISYDKALTFKITFISLHNKEKIRVLETILRNHLTPFLNSPRKIKSFNTLLLIRDL